VLVTAAGSFAVLVGVVQTPVVSRFFGCRPLDPFAWGAVLCWSVAGAAGAELVPRWLAPLQESHIHAVSLQESGFPDAPGHPGDASGADDTAAGEAGDTTTRAGVSVPAGSSEPT
jgi:hypothetical protein